MLKCLFPYFSLHYRLENQFYLTPYFFNFTNSSYLEGIKNKPLISQGLYILILFSADVAVIIKLKGIKIALHVLWSANNPLFYILIFFIISFLANSLNTCNVVCAGTAKLITYVVTVICMII